MADAPVITEYADIAATPVGLPHGSLLHDGKETFVALSQFVIANGMMEEVKAAFRGRPHLVDSAPGFVRMNVMVPGDSPDEIWLVTYWTDEDSYRVWHRSHEYHESHKGIPKGLKLVPGSAKIRCFEYVCS